MKRLHEHENQGAPSRAALCVRSRSPLERKRRCVASCVENRPDTVEWRVRCFAAVTGESLTEVTLPLERSTRDWDDLLESLSGSHPGTTCRVLLDGSPIASDLLRRPRGVFDLYVVRSPLSAEFVLRRALQKQVSTYLAGPPEHCDSALCLRVHQVVEADDLDSYAEAACLAWIPASWSQSNSRSELSKNISSISASAEFLVAVAYYLEFPLLSDDDKTLRTWIGQLSRRVRPSLSRRVVVYRLQLLVISIRLLVLFERRAIEEFGHLMRRAAPGLLISGQQLDFVVSDLRGRHGQ